mmetsp:Transcript_60030/g.104683  ORF Transcript_60030/g.104683 Transcript_60030/m.104683 type:complete len:87 (+) Transcript_60030:2-262(+)
MYLGSPSSRAKQEAKAMGNCCQTRWKGEGLGVECAYVYSTGCCCLLEAGFTLKNEPEDKNWEQCGIIIDGLLPEADAIVEAQVFMP